MAGLSVATLMAAAACGDGDAAPEAVPEEDGSEVQADDSVGTDTGNVADSDLCALLEDGEIEAVIGPHDGGVVSVDSGARYGLGSCTWKAAPQEVEGYPDGFVAWIEASVLEGDVADFAREDSEDGAPVDGLAAGALWDEIAARLWFDCGTGQLCHVFIGTPEETTTSGDTREAVALELGRLMLDRL